MILNTGVCDYLRVTTFEKNKSLAFPAFLATYTSDGSRIKEARLMGYHGERVDNLFWGESMQNGEPHYMLDISGQWANNLIEPAIRDYKITRVDFQITVPLVEEYSARKLRDDLIASDDWKVRGHRPGVRLIENENGMDTVYIGSRQSMRYVRIYVKEAMDMTRYLRFEVEFKGQLADEAVNKALLNGATKLLANEFWRLPDLKTRQWTMFRRCFVWSNYANNYIKRNNLRFKNAQMDY